MATQDSVSRKIISIVLITCLDGLIGGVIYTFFIHPPSWWIPMDDRTRRVLPVVFLIALALLYLEFCTKTVIGRSRLNRSSQKPFSWGIRVAKAFFFLLCWNMIMSLLLVGFVTAQYGYKLPIPALIPIGVADSGLASLLTYWVAKQIIQLYRSPRNNPQATAASPA